MVAIQIDPDKVVVYLVQVFLGCTASNSICPEVIMNNSKIPSKIPQVPICPDIRVNDKPDPTIKIRVGNKINIRQVCGA
jgi:hypothetical protein